MIGQIALWVVVVTALVSAADYFRRFGMFLNPKVVPLPSSPPKAQSSRKARLDDAFASVAFAGGVLDLLDALARLFEMLALLEFLDSFSK